MISLVVPCYWANDALFEMTAECLNSINDTTDGEPQEIFIIDDGSPIDGSFEDETDFVQEMKTIRRERNGGYCAAVNTGLFYAEGDVLILGNNDLVFADGWLPELLKPLEQGFDISTIWTSDQHVKLEDRIEEDAKFGSLFAMKREVYEMLGGFDERFRGYFGDLDYRRRALNAGFKIGKNLNAVVEHRAKATYTQTDPDDMEYQRGKLLYEAKWGYIE